MPLRKHALIFVHGMGKYDEDWDNDALSTLKAAFAEYPSLAKNFEFDKVFERVSVRYDDNFENLRAQWKDDFGGFKTMFLASMDAADNGEKDKVEKKLGEVSELVGAAEDEFLWTHAMDVILYRFFSTVRTAVNVSVAKQVLKVAKDTAKFSTWSVIAHSLGTAVLHNTLHALYETQLIAGEPPLRPTETRPNMIAMIANVTRVLQLPTVKAFESRVRPGSAIGGRATAFYLNIRHRWDPFVMPHPFEPDVDWVGATVFDSLQYQHIRPHHILVDDLRAVHDLEHYLKNPRVHAPIFRAILGKYSIPESEVEAVKTKFDSEMDAAIQAKVRDKLEPLLPSPNADWQAMIRLIVKGLSPK